MYIKLNLKGNSLSERKQFTVHYACILVGFVRSRRKMCQAVLLSQKKNVVRI